MGVTYSSRAGQVKSFPAARKPLSISNRQFPIWAVAVGSARGANRSPQRATLPHGIYGGDETAGFAGFLPNFWKLK
jgi:hypothetical protein